MEYIEDTGEQNENHMSFLDHLEELRWRILYSIIGVVIGAIIAWIFIDFLVDGILLEPAKKVNINLQNLKPFGQLFLYLEVALISGFLISIPNVFYQFWKFISPALTTKEKKYINGIVFFSAFCFFSGLVFAYYIMLPVTLKFAMQFGTETIENNFAIAEYISIVFSIMLAAAIIFELPMLSFFLSSIGLLTTKFMRKYRKHAIVVIMIFAAFLSPGTDPVAQLLLAIPLAVLYEISIFVCKIFQRKSA